MFSLNFSQLHGCLFSVRLNLGFPPQNHKSSTPPHNDLVPSCITCPIQSHPHVYMVPFGTAYRQIHTPEYILTMIY